MKRQLIQYCNTTTLQDSLVGQRKKGIEMFLLHSHALISKTNLKGRYYYTVLDDLSTTTGFTCIIQLLNIIIPQNHKNVN